MKEFIINKNDSGQRLDKFVSKCCPDLPASLLYKYIRLKRIKVNGKKSELSYKLNENDVVNMYINDEFFTSEKNEFTFLHASTNLNIIYEDENLLLLNKPVGLVVHEDESASTDTLINRIIKYLYEKKEYIPEKEHSFVPALCNRIDRNTSGIVIAAKNAETLRILNEKIKAREIDKYYLCIVKGAPLNNEATLTAYLQKDSNNNTVKIFKQQVPGAKTIITKYKILKRFDGYSLLEVLLLTGRTHQIRAHFAYLGHPLAGDGKYGDYEFNKKYSIKTQALCSYKLTFAFKEPAGVLEYLKGKTFEIKDVWFKNGL